MKVRFEVSDDYMNEVRQEIKNELTPEIINEEVIKYLGNMDVSVLYIIKNHLKLYERLKNIKSKTVAELDGDERFLVALYKLTNDTSSFALF